MVRIGRCLAYFEAIDLENTFRGAFLIPDDGSTLDGGLLALLDLYCRRLQQLRVAMAPPYFPDPKLAQPGMTCVGRLPGAFPLRCLAPRVDAGCAFQAHSVQQLKLYPMAFVGSTAAVFIGEVAY